MTFPALSGARKQSVEDVERLFGQGVIDFMKNNNYSAEAEYLQRVRNWRRAVDERGSSENIETRQWRRGFNLMNGIPVEHPRSSTTDDVECFF